MCSYNLSVGQTLIFCLVLGDRAIACGGAGMAQKVGTGMVGIGQADAGVGGSAGVQW